MIIYNRIENSYFFNKPQFLSVEILFTKQILNNSYVNSESGFRMQIFDSIFCGVLFFALCFNLYFFVVIREKVYFYYSMWMLYLLIENFSEPIGNMIFRGSPAVLYTIFNLNRAVGPLLMVQFVRRFLKLYLDLPRWDKMFKTVITGDEVNASKRTRICNF